MVANRESFNYLQIDRQVLSGADQFLPKVSEIGREVLGLISAGSKSDFHVVADEASGEINALNQHTPLFESRLNVFSADDLKMILLRRAAPREMQGRTNFSYQASRFEAKPSKGSQAKKSSDRNKTFIQHLDEMSGGISHVYCDSAEVVEDPIWGSTLVLSPKVSRERFILHKQAGRTLDFLKGNSPKMAYAASPWRPVVPFATIPEGIDKWEVEEDLLDRINTLLPVRLVMGGVQAYSNAVAVRKYSAAT